MNIDVILGEDDADNNVVIYRSYYNQSVSNDVFCYLRDNLGFIQNTITLHNRTCDLPRLSCYMGDDDVNTHNYSGMVNNVKSWDYVCRNIRDEVSRLTGMTYDSALVNYYRDGKDYIAYHSDREAEGSHNSVAAVSFGCTRRFYFKNKHSNRVVKTYMSNGDLMVMKGNINRLWKHTVPKQSGVTQRISVTFRNLTGKV